VFSEQTLTLRKPAAHKASRPTGKLQRDRTAVLRSL